MAGTDDRAVLDAQRDVLADARTLHQISLHEAHDLELRASVTEHRAQDEALHALAVARRAHVAVLAARQMQQEQRAAVRGCTADIAEIDEVLRLLPGQRPSCD